MDDNLETLNDYLNLIFKKLIKDGMEAGVSWKDASLKNVEYEIIEKDGNRVMDLFLVVEYVGMSYQIKLADCIYSGRGWVMFGGDLVFVG